MNIQEKYALTLSAYAGSFVAVDDRWTLLKLAASIKLETAGDNKKDRLTAIDTVKKDALIVLEAMLTSAAIPANVLKSAKKTTQNSTALIKRAVKNGLDFEPMAMIALETACKAAENPEPAAEPETETAAAEPAAAKPKAKTEPAAAVEPVTTADIHRIERVALTGELSPAAQAEMIKAYNALINNLTEPQIFALTNRLIEFCESGKAESIAA